jgi:hypothetical protein
MKRFFPRTPFSKNPTLHDLYGWCRVGCRVETLNLNLTCRVCRVFGRYRREHAQAHTHVRTDVHTRHAIMAARWPETLHTLHGWAVWLSSFEPKKVPVGLALNPTLKPYMAGAAWP